MKKAMYILPAAIVCLVYGFLALLVGGFGGFQPIAWAYIGLPILAALLLLKGKWWGCLPGIMLGTLLLYMSNQHTGQVLDIEAPLGMVLGIYYMVAGFLCYRAQKKN